MEMTTIFKLVRSLFMNEKVEVVTNELQLPSTDQALISLLQKHGFKESFIEGIMQVNNCEFKWIDPSTPNVVGLANILSVEDVIASKADYKEIGRDSPSFKHFHLVDMVRPDWGVGIFSGKLATNSLYVERSNGRAEYLGLNMEGYVKMLIATRGYADWQSALIDYKLGEERTTALSVMKKELPRLFPEVNMDEVFALYDSLYFEEATPSGI
jgi:hypothetical protein